MPLHSEDGICFKDRQSRYRARQVFMHCCLAVRAAARVGEAISASRALSVPVLNDRSTAKSAEMTENDRLLHFMVRPFQLKNTASLEYANVAVPAPTHAVRSRRSPDFQSPPGCAGGLGQSDRRLFGLFRSNRSCRKIKPLLGVPIVDVIFRTSWVGATFV